MRGQTYSFHHTLRTKPVLSLAPERIRNADLKYRTTPTSPRAWQSSLQDHWGEDVPYQSTATGPSETWTDCRQLMHSTKR